MNVYANCLWPAAGFSGFDATAKVIATLSQRDFYRLRECSNEFLGWRDYHDFRIERDCEFLCACSAGLAARQQYVPYRLFRAWSRLTGSPLSLAHLDDFAFRWTMRRQCAKISLVGKFTFRDDPFAPVLKNGALVIPIAQAAFEAWMSALARLSAVTTSSTLDHYVMLTAEAALPIPSENTKR